MKDHVLYFHPYEILILIHPSGDILPPPLQTTI